MYVVCTYFYKQNIQNFLISPSSKYQGINQTRTTIMRGVVSSFMLILHTVLLIKTLLSRARGGVVLIADYFFTEDTTRGLKPTLLPLPELMFQSKHHGEVLTSNTEFLVAAIQSKYLFHHKVPE